MQDNHKRNIRKRNVSEARLRHSLADRVGRAFRRLNTAFTSALKPHGISPVDANIVGILWIDGPMRIGQLQQRLAMNSSTFTGAVDRLEQAGYLVRTPAPGDRRATILEPLPLHGNLQAEIEEALVEAEDLFFSGLTGDEKRELARLLRKVSATEV